MSSPPSSPTPGSPRRTLSRRPSFSSKPNHSRRTSLDAALPLPTPPNPTITTTPTLQRSDSQKTLNANRPEPSSSNPNAPTEQQGRPRIPKVGGDSLAGVLAVTKSSVDDEDAESTSSLSERSLEGGDEPSLEDPEDGKLGYLGIPRAPKPPGDDHEFHRLSKVLEMSERGSMDSRGGAGSSLGRRSDEREVVPVRMEVRAPGAPVGVGGRVRPTAGTGWGEQRSAERRGFEERRGEEGVAEGQKTPTKRRGSIGKKIVEVTKGVKKSVSSRSLKGGSAAGRAGKGESSVQTELPVTGSSRAEGASGRSDPLEGGVVGTQDSHLPDEPRPLRSRKSSFSRVHERSAEVLGAVKSGLKKVASSPKLDLKKSFGNLKGKKKE